MNTQGRVLVIDNDASIRELIDVALSTEGYDVRTVADGSAALAMLQEWQPGVILLDMIMPGTDGWAFAAAYPTMWATELGADSALPKPFNLDDLLSVAEHYHSANPG